MATCLELSRSNYDLVFKEVCVLLFLSFCICALAKMDLKHCCFKFSFLSLDCVFLPH